MTSTQGARDLVQAQRSIQERLQAVDVEKELPVWRLAERILGERAHPWSRLTAELERSLVQDVRLRSLQRARDAAQQVELRIRGEARSRAAEEAFVQSLQKNACFSQVVLEREAERQGGGVEFEYTLSLSAAPPAYAPLPKYGARKAETAAVQAAPARTPSAIAAPPQPPASAPRPVQPRIPLPGQPGKGAPMNGPLRASRMRMATGGILLLLAASALVFVLPDASERKIRQQQASEAAMKELAAQQERLAALRTMDEGLARNRKRVANLLGGMPDESPGQLQWKLSRRLYQLAQQNGVSLQSLKYGSPTREGAKGNRSRGAGRPNSPPSASTRTSSPSCWASRTPARAPFPSLSWARSWRKAPRGPA